MARSLDPLDEIVRVNLKRFREEVDLSQSEAAELSGVPIDNLRRYESGVTANVPGVVLYQLANVYGHTVDDFHQVDPPRAKREDLPMFFLRVRPGVQVDHETRSRLQKVIDDANEALPERSKK